MLLIDQEPPMHKEAELKQRHNLRSARSSTSPISCASIGIFVARGSQIRILSGGSCGTEE
jgi:hypothetical protein